MDAQEQRRLLELAARAAGYKYVIDYIGARIIAHGHWEWWNPLTDDGDALRLAVKLGLWLHIGKYHTAIEGTRIEESAHGDPYAATCRAIVRAAAAVGEQMENNQS